MTTTDRTTAPDAAFAARLAGIESAPYADESARADEQEHYRRLARAALAAMSGPVSDAGAVVDRWIEEAARALKAATVISERMHRTGQVEGLNLGNHDRLVGEADRIRAALRPAVVAGEGER